jgi:hypothetical protein
MWHQPAGQFETGLLKLFRESGREAATLQAINHYLINFLRYEGVDH